MGYSSAVGMIEAGSADLVLSWHLTSNHYPPLPASILPVAKRAIRAAKRGDWDHKLRLPKGISWRGQSAAPVSACIEAWHLDAFLEAR